MIIFCNFVDIKYDSGFQIVLCVTILGNFWLKLQKLF